MIILKIVVVTISEDTCLVIRKTAHVWIDGRTSVFLNFLQMVGRD